MNTAYSFKASKYPVDKLVDLYSFTDRGHVITECKHCGLNVSEDKQFVNFHKGSFSSTEKVRLKKYHRGNILCFSFAIVSPTIIY